MTCPCEGQPQDVPLHRVGVLELVDEYDGVTVADPLPSRLAVPLVLQGVAELVQQVVVVEELAVALAPLDLEPGGAGEADAVAGLARGVGVGRDEQRLPVVDGVAGDGACRRVAHRRHRGAGCGVLAEVEVVDDLVDQVVEVLDEGGVGVVVAGHPEPGEHLLAEAVRGGDRGGVEAGERNGDASTAEGDLGVVGVREEPQQVVATGPRRVGVGEAAFGVASRSRTRSRSSCVAARPKVTSISWLSSARPSAT